MTPTQQRIHIGIFGKTNVGKSSLMNSLVGQEVSIISDTPGTTTDPIRKTVELPLIGPVVLIDTAGLDDKTALGGARQQATKNEIPKIDFAILIFSHNQFSDSETQLILNFSKLNLPYLLLYNEFPNEPLSSTLQDQLNQNFLGKWLSLNLKSSSDISQSELLQPLINKMQSLLSQPQEKDLFQGKIKANDLVLLVTPIDEEAPKGRMILPQVQTIRALLDSHAHLAIIQPNELNSWLQTEKRQPKLVITDSQAFGEVYKKLPSNWELTSFSVLLAQHQGPFEQYLIDTPQIEKLQEGDKVLILESCSHRTSCNDIGRSKIPKLLEKKVGAALKFEFISGLDPLPPNLEQYSFIIQCGGCMVTERQLKNRLQPFIALNIPISNYGMTISFCLGIFQKAIHFFLED